MRNFDLNIDDVYRNKFSGYQVPLSKGSWTKVSVKAAKLKFWQFNLSTFNVYYSALITASFLVIIGLALKVFFFENKKESSKTPMHQTTMPPVQKVNIIDSSNIKTTSTTDLDDKQDKKQEKNLRKIVKKESVKKNNVVDANKDNSGIVKKEISSVDTIKTEKKGVKHKTIMVRDTVFYYNKKQ